MAISNEEQFSKYLNELLAPSSLSTLFAIYLFKDLLHHSPAMQICDSLVELLMGISFFFLQDNNWNEAETTNKTVSLEHNNISSENWFARNFKAIVFNIIITFFIWSLIILAINNTIYSPDSSNNSVPYHGGSILVALGVIFINLRKALRLDSKIASIFVGVLILTGTIMMALYSTQ